MTNIISNTETIPLSPAEIERYSRQIVIPEIGVEGQEKLKAARVLIIGAGGLGSPLALYLTAAGIGTLGIIDFDEVNFSNLQRQILFSSGDVGLPKAEIAKMKLKSLNPEIEIKIYNDKLTNSNALEILSEFDLIADGSDNFATRYLVNDAAAILRKPVAYGSILKFNGQASFFNSVSGPCYRCLYPDPPKAGEIPSCDEAGVLGALAGIIGSIQANEVLKYFLGIGTLLEGRLLMLDSLEMKFKELKFEKNPDCLVCGDNPSIKELIDYDLFCGVNKNENNIKLNNMSDSRTSEEISVEELKQKIESGEKVNLLDVRQEFETEIATLGGVVIPINSLPGRLDELEKFKKEELIIYCHSGINSYYAMEFLKQEAGFTNVKNLTGGIAEWAYKIDPTMKKY